MPWHELQSAFSSALRNGNEAVPGGIGKSGGRPASNRFNVYRNNRAVSLRDALATSYPVVMALVGEEFFSALARQFIESNPPRTPVLLAYGDTLPDFLDVFPPAASLPFLSDVARIERAFIRAYHAADAAPLTLASLAAMAPEDVAEARLAAHPALQRISSGYPALSIWQAHQEENTATKLAGLEQGSECAMVTRPSLEVKTFLLPPNVFGLLDHLAGGATLGEAAEALGGEATEDFGGMLAFLVNSGAFASTTSS